MILKVLVWLKEYNILYKDIIINFGLLNTWKKKFISASISNQVLQYSNDTQNKEGYTINLEIQNFASQY